jgi:hemolysin III
MDLTPDLDNEANKPTMRGVLHRYSFFGALIVGVWAFDKVHPEHRFGIAVLIAAICLCFGTSALYHGVHWRERSRVWMRRADHSMIFVTIAGIFTLVGMYLIEPGLGQGLLVFFWSAAVIGTLIKLLWIEAPRRLSTGLYLLVSWAAILAFPGLREAIGLAPTLFMLLGGVTISLGAISYARKTPNPIPGVFGYHEVFHACVLFGLATFYTVLLRHFLALPITT